MVLNNQHLKVFLLFMGVLLSTVSFGQTKKTLAISGDGWYRIISGTTSQGAGMVRISGISGSNRQTNMTLNVSLMRFGQGASINILDNVFYNLNHIVNVRAGSVGGQEFVVDVQLAGTSGGGSMTIEVDNTTLPIVATAIKNPTPPDGTVAQISGRVIGVESTRWPVYLGTEVGIGTIDPTDGKLHVVNDATLGDWGNISTENATVRIQDNNASMYIDGNTIYANALMNIGTIGNHNLTFGTDDTKRMTILNDGNVGIGVSSPSERLEVNGTVLSDNIRTDQNNTKYSQIIRNGNGTALYVNQVHADKPIMRLSSGTAAANEGVKFSVESTGATRIGTHQIPSGYMLAVAGKAIMTEVKVQVTPWPDYVFTPSYDLKSLDQVETFINENGHLPNIPSAQEVEENNGIELGEMNAKLLEKIEELTLYQIQLMKELKSMKAENQAQQKEIDQLKSDR